MQKTKLFVSFTLYMVTDNLWVTHSQHSITECEVDPEQDLDLYGER